MADTVIVKTDRDPIAGRDHGAAVGGHHPGQGPPLLVLAPDIREPRGEEEVGWPRLERLVGDLPRVQLAESPALVVSPPVERGVLDARVAA